MVRLKTRYLVVEVTGARKLTIKKEDIVVLIRESIIKSYGDYGSGLAQYAFQGSSHGCRDFVLKFSMERAKTMNLYTLQPNFDEKIQAEIALVDPK
ncbi:hypothetical protein KXD40_006186 [Peronospora effusa]|nr:hypothetical protein KXD40_006186 [Peronospora effusa]